MSSSENSGVIQSVSSGVNSKVEKITKTFKGNLILDGKSSPLMLSGEVFVDGDVVIRGKYKGTGTIYAQNIFIVDDLIAVSSP